MRVVTDTGTIQLGQAEVTPSIGITDFSRRVTDDFGVTTVVERGFRRRLTARLGIASDQVDGVQRSLAALRATSANWIVDDSLAWLSVEGFYKDFELELAAGTLSYCKLTVEGLTETEVVADPGGDPAIAGEVSSFRLLQPVTIADASLTSSSVAQSDYPEWVAGSSYAAGARVIKSVTHRIYESIAGENVGHDPATSTGKWLDLGPTNRWAMFDQALGTATSAAGSVSVTLSAGSVNAVALLDVIASSVRVQSQGYDRTRSPVGGSVTFLDLPTTTGGVTVTITGSGTVSIGTLLIGKVVGLGTTEASPTAGISDFSRKVADDFGEITVVERAWAKRMSARTLIRTDAVDIVANRIAKVRATPSLWIGGEGVQALTVYGFFRDFSIEIGDSTSQLSLSIEGLSKAAPIIIPDVGGDGLSSAQVTIYRRSATLPALPSADVNYTFATGGLAGLTNGWTRTPPAADGNPLYAAIASAAGANPTDTIAPNEWSEPVVFSQDGTGGLNSATIYLFRRAATSPPLPGAPATYTFATATLTGHDNGWSQTVPAGSDPLYVTTATAVSTGATDTIPASEWAAARVMAQNGADGANGLNNARVTIYQRSVGVPALPSAATTYTFVTGALTGLDNGWSTSVPATNGSPLYAALATASSAGATDTIAPNEWTSPVVIAQDGSGGSGSPGINSASVYLYQRAAPAPPLPSTTATYTFATAGLSGHDNGWSRTIPGGTLPLWVTTATAAATGATDTIAASEWAAAQVLAKDGAPGEDGTDGQDGAGLVANPVVVSCNSLGVPLPGELPKPVRFILNVGGQNVSASAVWSQISITNGQGNHVGNGLTFLDEMSADTATLAISATYEGSTYTSSVQASKVRAGSDAQTFRQDITVQPTTSYSPAGTLQANVFPNTTIEFSVSAIYGMTINGTGRVQAKLMYRNISDGGAWTQIGAEQIGSDSTRTEAIPGEPNLTNGSLGGVVTMAGPSEAKLYEFRIEWLRTNSLSVGAAGIQVSLK